MGDLTCKWEEDERVKPLSTHNSRPVSNEPKLETPLEAHTSNEFFQKAWFAYLSLSTPWECPMKEKYLVFQLFQGINSLGLNSGRCWLVMDLCSPTSCVCLQGSAQTWQGDAAICAVGQQNRWEAFLPAHRPSLQDQSALEDELAQLVAVKFLPQTLRQGNPGEGS